MKTWGQESERGKRQLITALRLQLEFIQMVDWKEAGINPQEIIKSEIKKFLHRHEANETEVISRLDQIPA